MGLPEKLTYLRKKEKKLQKDVASFLGVTRQAYNNYENGIRTPDMETMKRIADYFGTSVDFLLSDIQDPQTRYEVNRQKVLDIINEVKGDNQEELKINFYNFEDYSDEDIEDFKAFIKMWYDRKRKK